MLDTDELSFVRSHLDFYEKLSESEKQMIDRAVTKTRFRKGASLRSKDSECLGVLLVHTGALRAYIQSEDGTRSHAITGWKAASSAFCRRHAYSTV